MPTISTSNPTCQRRVMMGCTRLRRGRGPWGRCAVYKVWCLQLFGIDGGGGGPGGRGQDLGGGHGEGVLRAIYGAELAVILVQLEGRGAGGGWCDGCNGILHYSRGVKGGAVGVCNDIWHVTAGCTRPRLGAAAREGAPSLTFACGVSGYIWRS